MRLHYLQHCPFEDAANISAWAQQRGHDVTCTRLHLDEPLPEPQSFDWLAVMGGPMNIYQHAVHPWLAREKEFLRRAIDRGGPVLGVCLGAQLAADVLGGRVTQNPHKEIGWFPVWLTEAARQSPVWRGFPDRFTPFHWHGDTFAIPPGAVRIAESEACPNQAFQFGRNVIGLQFHLDYSAESIEKMLANCKEELVDGPAIQRPDQLRSQADRLAEIRRLLYLLLDTAAGEMKG
jgi:GMP synthase-like glutamine amidotransferase